MAENRIFVTGATGKIGQNLLKILGEKGASATAFVRNPAKATGLAAGIKVVAGDLTDITSFEKAVVGHTHLFLLTNDPSSEAKLVSAALAAAPTLAHVVKISAIGADAGAEPGTFLALHGRAEQEVEAVARAKGVAVTYLRPHDFMENVFQQAATIKSQSTFYGAYGTAAIASISAYDIANVAATVLTSSEADRARFAGLGFTLTGPRALTLPERCAAISRAVGKEVRYVDVGDAGVFKSVEPTVGPLYAYLITYLAQWYRLHLTGNAWTTGNVEIITGRKPKSWEEFLEENKAALL